MFVDSQRAINPPRQFANVTLTGLKIRMEPRSLSGAPNRTPPAASPGADSVHPPGVFRGAERSSPLKGSARRPRAIERNTAHGRIFPRIPLGARRLSAVCARPRGELQPSAVLGRATSEFRGARRLGQDGRPVAGQSRSTRQANRTRRVPVPSAKCPRHARNAAAARLAE